MIGTSTVNLDFFIVINPFKKQSNGYNLKSYTYS